MANRPRCTPKCDFSPKRTDLKELSRTAGKTPRAEREKPQLTAASETFLPNGHSTTPPKSPESRQNPFRSVVYGEKIGFGARFGLDPNTREPRASVDKAPEGTRFPEARLQGLFGMREVPGAARGAQGRRGAQDCRYAHLSRMQCAAMPAHQRVRTATAALPPPAVAGLMHLLPYTRLHDAACAPKSAHASIELADSKEQGLWEKIRTGRSDRVDSRESPSAWGSRLFSRRARRPS